MALVAATPTEITIRIPGTEDSFGLVVGGTSALIIGIGAIAYFVANFQVRGGSPVRDIQ